MKYYIASKLILKDKVIEIQKRLAEMGYYPTFDWTEIPDITPYDKHKEECSKRGEIEIKAVIDADFFLLFADKDGFTSHLEAGAALAAMKINGKPKFYVIKENKDSPWFYVKGVIECEDVEDFFKRLENE